MNFTEKNKLRPCPYCGGEAHSTGYKDAYKNERHNVECSECGAEAGYGDATGGLSWTSESESTKAWNTRATDARVSELEEANYQLMLTLRNLADACEGAEIEIHHERGLGARVDSDALSGAKFLLNKNKG